MQTIYLVRGIVDKTSILYQDGLEILIIEFKNGATAEIPVHLINKSSPASITADLPMQITYVYANANDYDHKNESGYHLEKLQ